MKRVSGEKRLLSAGTKRTLVTGYGHRVNAGIVKPLIYFNYPHKVQEICSWYQLKTKCVIPQISQLINIVVGYFRHWQPLL